MFSLEPATVTHEWYPELFQVGETAHGLSIVDGQHPHDFFMELAALYDLRIQEKTYLTFYAAPIGDPALGPVAYAHRASASEDPIATLGHHMQDSTHIASNVLTLAVTHRAVRAELSGFHGREPDEHRWGIDGGAVDSWSTRLTISPNNNWTGQYSVGRLHSPEAFHSAEDVLRMTASVMYNRKFARGNWASSLIWGRNRTLPEDQISNSYGLESTLKFANVNSVWTRVESADRTNELLAGPQPPDPAFPERSAGRVQAFTFGYDREFSLFPYVSTALGAQITGYAVPSVLETAYGRHPVGGVLFLRLRTKSNH